MSGDAASGELGDVPSPAAGNASEPQGAARLLIAALAWAGVVGIALGPPLTLMMHTLSWRERLGGLLVFFALGAAVGAAVRLSHAADAAGRAVLARALLVGPGLAAAGVPLAVSRAASGSLGLASANGFATDQDAILTLAAGFLGAGLALTAVGAAAHRAWRGRELADPWTARVTRWGVFGGLGAVTAAAALALLLFEPPPLKASLPLAALSVLTFGGAAALGGGAVALLLPRAFAAAERLERRWLPPPPE